MDVSKTCVVVPCSLLRQDYLLNQGTLLRLKFGNVKAFNCELLLVAEQYNFVSARDVGSEAYDCISNAILNNDSYLESSFW
jgi:hypothetical protein